MPENLSEKQANRQVRIEKEKDENNLIADNGLKDVVYDVYDIIATSREPEAIKLRNLIASGVNEQYIVQVYSNLSGKVESMEEALNLLGSTFIILATEISKQPNGIVIDMSTGLIDEEKSAIQAKRLGLEYDENLSKKNTEILKEFEKTNPAEELVNSIGETLTLNDIENEIGNIANDDWLYNISDAKHILINTSEKYVDEVNANLDIIKKYSKEKMSLIRIEHDMEHAKGTPEYDRLLEKKLKFLKNHPELKKLQLRDENGELLPIVDEVMEAEKNVMVGIFLNKFREKGINENTDEETKRFMTMFALSAMKNDAFKEDALEVLGLKGKTLEEQLNIINSILKTKMKTEQDLQDKIDLFAESIEHATDISKMYDDIRNGKIHDEKIAELMDSMGQEMTITAIKDKLKENKKSSTEKYFSNSKLKFDKKDEKRLNEDYEHATIESWISRKEDALKYEFLLRILEKEELESLEVGSSTNDNAIKAIDNKLNKMLEANPELKELVGDDGKIKPENREEALTFKAAKEKSEIMKSFLKDINENGIITRADFDSMFLSGKKEYLRMAVIGLDYAEKNNNEALKKLALRRLEILNEGQPENEKIIEFDETGNYKLNENMMFDFLNDYSHIVGRSSYEDCLKKWKTSFYNHKIYNKLAVIGKLSDDKFIDINQVPESERLDTIERIKAGANVQNMEQRITNEDTEKIQVEDKQVTEKGGILNTIKNFIKRVQNRKQPRLTDGNVKVEEKKGFFSKLFNRKEKEDITRVNINMNEDKGHSLKTKTSFDESLRYGDRDGSLEKSALSDMKKQVEDSKEQEQEQYLS